MRNKKISPVVLALVSLATPTLWSHAQSQTQTYTITDLGTLGGTSSIACGMNNRGQVVGFSFDAAGQPHAFLWSDGLMTDLGELPDDFVSEARDINGHGQAVGDSQVSRFRPPFHATLWENGQVIPLGTLGGGSSFAVAINQRAQVVGGSATGSGELHAFLWEDGVMSDLGTLPGDTFSVSRGINKPGQIVGNSAPRLPGFFGDCPTTPRAVQPQHATLWDNGDIADLGTLGGTFSIAKAINDHGRIVGSSTLSSGEEHAFLLRDGTMMDLGTLGGAYSLANQINNHTQVVGLSRIAGGELHAFIWDDGVMTDLNNLIPQGPGWVLVEATAINQCGYIAGFGAINGQTHAFLLTPSED